MSDQNNGQVSTLQRPTTDDPDAWKVYWRAQGWPWRTEPEIDTERQKFLTERRAIVPDIEKGIYPFKDIKLSRADVEWLLATHENGRGPIDWDDEGQRRRPSIDLRGADLRYVNLQHLPLASMRGGLTLNEMEDASEIQCRMAAALMEGVDLHASHLELAFLSWACLKGADLRWSHLERARLHTANLERASLQGTHLEGARLNNVIFSNEKHIGPQLADIHWGDVNLTVIKWSQIKMLGDEYEARQKQHNKKLKDRNTQLEEYEVAVRANRQLAVALQAQGLNEDAARFAYRAQKLQRIVLRLQKKFGQYLFSLFLNLLAGYGYRPGRSVLWYLTVIFSFALAYFAIGHLPFWPDALVYSLTSFHGRGFLPNLDGQLVTLHYPLVVMAAFEAVIGLLIEISFIATFTQRFFGR